MKINLFDFPAQTSHTEHLSQTHHARHIVRAYSCTGFQSSAAINKRPNRNVSILFIDFSRTTASTNNFKIKPLFYASICTEQRFKKSIYKCDALHQFNRVLFI